MQEARGYLQGLSPVPLWILQPLCQKNPCLGMHPGWQGTSSPSLLLLCPAFPRWTAQAQLFWNFSCCLTFLVKVLANPPNFLKLPPPGSPPLPRLLENLLSLTLHSNVHF